MTFWEKNAFEFCEDLEYAEFGDNIIELNDIVNDPDYKKKKLKKYWFTGCYRLKFIYVDGKKIDLH